MTKDDVNLFIISLLNIQYLFPSKLTIKINLIHEEFQCSVYRRFFKELFNNTEQGKFKMIYMNKYDLYKKKWDFETEFLLEKHRKKKTEIFERALSIETLSEENLSFNNNIYNQKKEVLLNNSVNNDVRNNFFQKLKRLSIYKSQRIELNKNNKSLIITKNDTNKSNKNFINSLSNSNSLTKSSSGKNNSLILNISNNLYKMENNPNKNFENLHYDYIIEKFKKSLGLILLTIDSLYNFSNMKDWI